jgi:predicted GIY-YIG superfamily endonuclease
VQREHRKAESAMSGGTYLYILLCADESYYTGTTRADLEYRVNTTPAPMVATRPRGAP